MDADRTDAVFSALAHKARRQMLDIVFGSPGCGVSRVAAHFPTSRIAVLKHIRILEAAGLLHSRKEGRVRRLFFDPVPIQRIHDRWTDRYGALFAGRMSDIKDRVESRAARRAVKRA